MTYLRYAPDIETPAPDEQKSIDGIIQGMTQQSQVVEKREHHAVRASHAQSSACVVGELIVPENEAVACDERSILLVRSDSPAPSICPRGSLRGLGELAGISL